MNAENRIHELLTTQEQVHIVIALPDMHITMIRNQKDWNIFIEDVGEDAPNFDNAISKHEIHKLTDIQIGAILALIAGIGEQSTNQGLIEQLYSIAEPCFDGVPANLRPIP